MNAKERRKQRRKLQKGGVKNAYARIGGKITEVEMLDKAPPLKKRAPVIIDGETIEEIPQAHAEDLDVSDEIFRDLARNSVWIFGTDETRKPEKEND